MNNIFWFIICMSTACMSTATLAADGPNQRERTADVIGQDSAKASAKILAGAFHVINQKLPPELRKKAYEQVEKTFINIDPDAMSKVLTRLKAMKPDAMVRLTKIKNGFSAFSRTLLDEGASNTRQLSKIIGYSKDGLDEAGATTLKLLNKVDAALDGAGTVTKDMATHLKDAIRRLPPKRARAVEKWIRLKNWAKKPTGSVLADRLSIIGTSVDGLFVLKDAYDICQSDDPEEKAARATSTLIGYGTDLVGGAAITAMGGGLPHIILLSWSGSQVKGMVNEMIRLQFDQVNASTAEERTRAQLRMMMIEGMVKINDSIRLGALAKASTRLRKIEAFYHKNVENMDLHGLSERLQQLKSNLTKAERVFKINAIIDEANRHVHDAIVWAHRGLYLLQAKKETQIAKAYLQQKRSLYPELQPALTKIETLLKVIETKIGQADPLRIERIIGPKSVKPRKEVAFELVVSGGLPPYTSAGLLLIARRVFWYAPEKQGTVTVSFQVQDTRSQIASASKKVVVKDDAIPSATEASKTKNRFIKIAGYQETYRSTSIAWFYKKEKKTTLYQQSFIRTRPATFSATFYPPTNNPYSYAFMNQRDLKPGDATYNFKIELSHAKLTDAYFRSHWGKKLAELVPGRQITYEDPYTLFDSNRKLYLLVRPWRCIVIGRNAHEVIILEGKLTLNEKLTRSPIPGGTPDASSHMKVFIQKEMLRIMNDLLLDL